MLPPGDKRDDLESTFFICIFIVLSEGQVFLLCQCNGVY